MRVRADGVAVDGAHGPLLAATSLAVGPGQLALVAGPPGAGHTAFGLALTGRMALSAGSVEPGAAALRAGSALVDAPGVSEPEGALRAADVVAEEMALGGGRARRRDVAALLDEHGVDGAARFENVSPAARTALLTALAARRRGVRLLVLHTPDRHAADHGDWWPTALRHARAGLAVVVLCGATAARALPLEPARLGSVEQPGPLDLAQEAIA
ncbi:ABC transporter ATP-binding protein [Actinokineospora pegani]|uniref:ABC transporter ATP-binding protein n=1 Tax=Actinokineospora pegani TaxID=2654637 RepID=UPI0012E9F426|nr:ABC transporter ATP-binding protein [Actinokineospora pegani]